MKLKKIWGFIAVFIALFSLTNVKAFSVENDTLTLEPGSKEAIHLYANTEEEIDTIKFVLTYSTNDLKGTNFTAAKGVKDTYDGNSTHVIKLSEAQSGKIDLGTINIKTVSSPKDAGGTVTVQEVTKNNDNVIGLKKLVVLIQIGEKDEETGEPVVISEPVINETSDSLLEGIDSSIVSIELRKNVYEYTVTVPADTTELDLKPVTSSVDVRATVSSQVINELEDGVITITLENGKVTQQYKINVKVKKAVVETEIDKTTEVKEYHYKWKYIVVIILCVVVIAGTYLIKLPKGD